MTPTPAQICSKDQDELLGRKWKSMIRPPRECDVAILLSFRQVDPSILPSCMSYCRRFPSRFWANSRKRRVVWAIVAYSRPPINAKIACPSSDGLSGSATNA